MRDDTECRLNIIDLYPDLTPEDQHLAEQNLIEFIRIIEQIAEHEFALQPTEQVAENAESN